MLSFFWDAESLLMVIGVIGTTITPWGQFYVQASVVDKGITAVEYNYTCLDVIVGSFFTWLVAFFIIIATASTLYVNGIAIETATDAAIALAAFILPPAPPTRFAKRSASNMASASLTRKLRYFSACTPY